MKLFGVALSVFAFCGSVLAGPADTINVHFDNPVLVGEKTLPAGDVQINLLRGSNSVILTARAEDGTVAAVVVNRIWDNDEPAQTSVVLGKRGKELKLERIWLGTHMGYAIPFEGK